MGKSNPASAAARRRAARRPGSSFATPGYSPSKTVAPSGSALSARSREEPGRDGFGKDTLGGENAVEAGETGNWVARATAAARASSPAARRRRARLRLGGVLMGGGLRWVTA